jgi:hypothetical protein
MLDLDSLKVRTNNGGQNGWRFMKNTTTKALHLITYNLDPGLTIRSMQSLTNRLVLY